MLAKEEQEEEERDFCLNTLLEVVGWQYNVCRKGLLLFATASCLRSVTANNNRC